MSGAVGRASLRLSACRQLYLQCRHTSSRSRVVRTPNYTSPTAKWVMPKFKEFKKRNDRMMEEKTLPFNLERRSTYIEWNIDVETSAFMARIGEKLDRGLWEIAITDKSYVLHQEETRQSLGLTATPTDEASDPAPARPSNCELAEEGRDILKGAAQAWLSLARPCLPLEALRAYVDHLDSDAVMSDVALSMGLRAIVLQEEGPNPTPVALARAARAIIAVVQRCAGPQRTAAFVEQRLVPFVLTKDVFDVYELEEPLLAVERALAASGGSVEARLVAEAGRHTLEAVFEVALYDDRRVMLSSGFGETVDIAVAEAARECLRRMWGVTPSAPPLPFTPSLPPPHANLPHLPAASNAPSNVPMGKFSLDNADVRYDNIVVC